jgi:hypothetical protein
MSLFYAQKYSPSLILMNGSGWGDTGVSGFFNQNLSNYGLNRGVSSEDWHVSPSN